MLIDVKTKSAPVLALVILSILVQPATANSEAYTPPSGSAERKAILDAYRAEYTKDALTKEVIFVVKHLKAHDGWAWLEVNPKSADGSQQFEPEQGLLHKEGAGWKVLQRKSSFRHPSRSGSWSWIRICAASAGSRRSKCI